MQRNALRNVAFPEKAIVDSQSIRKKPQAVKRPALCILISSDMLSTKCDASLFRSYEEL